MSEISNLIATDEIQVEITIRLGRAKMSIADISLLSSDDVINLDHDISKGVQVCIGERIIARGELTAVEGSDDRIGVRILGPALES
ncbi:FliM/FliN family flagellar motor switch protein [Paracoccus sp. (in: a-proteobacteria)]|uniref:FliM/FliN family flagellar motor switch protein n=1 Tax=Paracoccus sp. TaxID=267 RepID=UPI002898DD4F|nr:FliM/FliN family flagellar motor switch protein [Paracoccus sp. (in: a-proteobacteria)]